MEEWKDIKGYEGLYQVSNEGRVKSLNRKCKKWNGDRKVKEKIISFTNVSGYLKVTLFRNGIRHYYLVHRLVAEAFIPNPDNKPCIDHVNTVKTDNIVENLRWVTVKENINNPITKKKLKRPMPKLRKKVYQYTMDGKLVKIWNSTLNAGENGFNAGHVANCCRGEEKQHKGYIWSYKPL